MEVSGSGHVIVRFEPGVDLDDDGYGGRLTFFEGHHHEGKKKDMGRLKRQASLESKPFASMDRART